ncbi:MAG: acetyl-CoA carboxylase biotin carboxyl carrier protein subunit [Flavobacteriaceae bacterium CG_4_8_14_3_um_filter_34_10]|nr:acetyl-CoA carboxylase biotin carboxyl carrier protein subunit [Flavobacteriia bacterium]OIP52476.1 MAG: acetyl-CoA carboxylase biotin carboxyl carrier protein subunit [Flavobacteriaceae bacterium CG2_30_34_30]PIQ17943.1 MAG: acetyl-CoA carboxylase biotin carboxyl carrier protein subunit [Flavobacteriaceae bacterium CG18_big_fil_WC_8_21_14_2_50_34_36]PIV51610.1 MAG: acetyl-CoA carboxylase biotin carboxyl carrier protein subunit [Flavobacteriaceae bacterium CG02_land_8_20_14_3_00_34_13]PIX090
MHTTFHITVNNTFKFVVAEAKLLAIDLQQKSENTWHILHQNKSLDVEVVTSDLINKRYTIKVNSSLYEVKIETALDVLITEMGLSLLETTAINDIKAPMPGLILDVLVKAGDEVKEGDYLLVLEAMKMENTITAPRNGIVKTVSVEKGKTVNKDQLLLEME